MGVHALMSVTELFWDEVHEGYKHDRHYVHPLFSSLVDAPEQYRYVVDTGSPMPVAERLMQETADTVSGRLLQGRGGGYGGGGYGGGGRGGGGRGGGGRGGG